LPINIGDFLKSKNDRVHGRALPLFLAKKAAQKRFLIDRLHERM